MRSMSLSMHCDIDVESVGELQKALMFWVGAGTELLGTGCRRKASAAPGWRRLMDEDGRASDSVLAAAVQPCRTNRLQSLEVVSTP